MSNTIIDHASGKPLAIHIQPRLNTKIVNSRPIPTPCNPSPASWYGVLLALLMVFAVAVAVAVSGVNP